MVWFQISWAPTISNEQNVWNVYMLENHAVTRTIHSNSNDSNSDKRLHSIPRFATSFLPHCCPPTNHFPYLLRQEALHKDTQLTTQQLKMSVSDPSWGITAHSHANSTTPVLLNYYTWNTCRSKTFCFYQTTTFHMKTIYTCKIDFPWSGWTSTYLLLWIQLVSINSMGRAGTKPFRSCTSVSMKILSTYPQYVCSYF